MKKTILVSSLLLALIVLLSSYGRFSDTKTANDDDKVLDVLVNLGDKKPLHYKPYSSLDKDKVQKGYELVTTGYTTNPQGKRTKVQSKHFVCTNCHNIKIEDPDLRYSDPNTRLDFVAKNDINFLPATTLYGIVNRETWYNDDYLRKYGNLVLPARDTLENAVHLCAVQCSQGRDLEDWEMEVVMDYFLSIGFNISDLKLTAKEKETIAKALSSNSNQEEAIKLIKSKYINYSPATFLDPLPNEKRLYGNFGNASRGKQIFELSCLTCHYEEGVTNYKLDKTVLTLNHLSTKANSDGHYSLYEITRKGTHPLPAYRPYMPLFTLERMSHEQLEDLMAYVKRKNEKK